MSLAKRNSEAAAKWAAKRRESQERALLQERSTSTSRRPIPAQNPPPSRYRASISHETNAAYMEEFREGMASMYLALEGPGGAPKEPAGQAQPRSRTHHPASGSSSSYSARSSRHHTQHRNSTKTGFLDDCLLADELKRDTVGDSSTASSGCWRRGPLDPAGNVSGTWLRRCLRAYTVGLSCTHDTTGCRNR